MKTFSPVLDLTDSPGWVLLNSETAGMSYDTCPNDSSYITSDNLLFNRLKARDHLGLLRPRALPTTVPLCQLQPCWGLYLFMYTHTSDKGQFISKETDRHMAVETCFSGLHWPCPRSASLSLQMSMT